MPKYILGYHGGSMPESEAEQAAVLAAWGAWFEQLGGAIVDGGNPTAAAKTIAPDGATADGGGANPLTGYSILQATDLDSAVILAKGCPIFAAGGSVEVGELVEM